MSDELERLKLQLEIEKLEIERQKLTVERYKARWSALAVGVPLLAIAATVCLGIWNQREQSKLSFSLKAAEIILNTDNPNITYNKSAALLSLFPGNLPADFAKSFDPKSFNVDEVGQYHLLVEQLLAKPEMADEILRIRTAAYPDDKWAANLQEKLSSGVVKR